MKDIIVKAVFEKAKGECLDKTKNALSKHVVNEIEKRFGEILNARTAVRAYEKYIDPKNIEIGAPNLDTLNLFCRYLGYENCKDFIKENSTQIVQNKVDGGIPSKVVFRKIIFTLVTVLIGVLLYLQFTLPFNTVFVISEQEGLSLDPDYPPFNEKNDSRLSLNLPGDMLPKEIGSDGKVVKIEIPSNLRNKTIKVSLKAKYWRLYQDSIVLQEGKVPLHILPDESLSRIQGEVFAQIGGLPIANTTVETNGISTVTDSNGLFELIVPLEKRKPEYDLRIFKKGYDSYSKTYYPGKKVKIGLTQKQ